VSAVDVQLAKAATPIAYFVELAFSTGTVRLTTWGVTINWGGFDWIGLGSIVGISKVAVSERPQYPAVDLSLSVGNPSILTLARGNVETYRGLDANVYRYILTDNNTYAGDPDLIWAGEMSQVRLDTGDGKTKGASITLRCEQRGRAQTNSTSLRIVAAQQEQRFPGDTALRHKEELMGQPQVWLSKKFQQNA
jgi:hypothetical protein